VLLERRAGAHRLQHPVGKPSGAAVDARQQQAELVAAEAGRQVLGAALL